MTNAQVYCSVNELISDLQLADGDEPRLMQRIREASQFIERRLGRFLPVAESRTLAGVSAETLNLNAPLLSIVSVQVDGVAVTDYTAKPSSRCWPNGPYTWLVRDAGWGESVVINGVWGWYDEVEDLPLTATQAADATTLVLASGNLVSRGMVLKIGDEQELVTAGNGSDYCPSPTLATTTLAAALDAMSEEVSVGDGAEFVAGEVLQIDVEDLFIRKIGGNKLICSRGWNGTTKAAHLDAAPISVYRTYTVLRGVNGTTAAAHAAAAVGRQVPPADVRWLALQIAALMKQKAATAFGGRAGNPESGETFYVNEFPRQIADIEKNYSIPYL